MSAAVPGIGHFKLWLGLISIVLTGQNMEKKQVCRNHFNKANSCSKFDNTIYFVLIIYVLCLYLLFSL